MASIREVLAVEETKMADVFKGPAVESRIDVPSAGKLLRKQWPQPSALCPAKTSTPCMATL